MDLSEHPATLPNCPDCYTPVGELHKLGCDVERCPTCGQQKLTCGCDSGHTVWTGEWPEVLHDVKARYDALIGMESEWATDFGHEPSVIYRSPNGFPFVLGFFYKGIKNKWTMTFGQPIGLHQEWLADDAKRKAGQACPHAAEIKALVNPTPSPIPSPEPHRSIPPTPGPVNRTPVPLPEPHLPAGYLPRHCS